MSLIINLLEYKPDLLFSGPVQEDVVRDAEVQLGLCFAPEYREYLLHYGIVAYGGHELTGISKSPRMNVVTVTLSERKEGLDIPSTLYVLECTHVEEVIIWQSETGELYWSSPNTTPVKFCDSLSEYVQH